MAKKVNEIVFAKIVSGELLIGKLDDEKNLYEGLEIKYERNHAHLVQIKMTPFMEIFNHNPIKVEKQFIIITLPPPEESIVAYKKQMAVLSEGATVDQEGQYLH